MNGKEKLDSPEKRVAGARLSEIKDAVNFLAPFDISEAAAKQQRIVNNYLELHQANQRLDEQPISQEEIAESQVSAALEAVDEVAAIRQQVDHLYNEAAQDVKREFGNAN